MRLAAAAVLVSSLSFARGVWADPRDDRPFQFSADGDTTAPRRVTAQYTVTWGASSEGAIRPIGAASVGLAGVLHMASAEFGIVEGLSLRAYGLLAQGGADVPMAATAGGELRARVLGRAGGPWQVALHAGVLRELSGAAAVQGRAVVTGNVGRLRLTANLLVERSTRPRADDVDVIVSAGASFAMTSWLRAGVEYIGQDLEAAWDDEELEGARHLLGPTIAVRSERQGLQLVGGPAFGLSASSPSLVLRAGVQYAF